ncbi:cysteine-rich DPF motif domain-containing protein 1 isoform X1 [Nerophis ophidion]|uniref:cysteine-rich DPF motif domain-containing protein 1 isoform X1 n=1 Tax=Nerophis ophidion TaxID=159077 RepID=UPI002ADFDC52|nr:cysteine-rich DPF motif domain-containing protein 1 isoform X1 [Nerophis ophidion]
MPTLHYAPDRSRPNHLPPLDSYPLVSFHGVSAPRHLGIVFFFVKMSDVRLSDATVERVDAPQQDNGRPPVRRALFGTPDPTEISECLNASIGEGVQAFKERYNFDPDLETPLPAGNFVWTVDRSAPEFFSRPPHRKKPSPAGAEGNKAQEAKNLAEQ